MRPAVCKQIAINALFDNEWAKRKAANILGLIYTTTPTKAAANAQIRKKFHKFGDVALEEEFDSTKAICGFHH